MKHTNWLALGLHNQLLNLGFHILGSKIVESTNHTVYSHTNGIVVIETEQQVFVIRDGYSLYIYDDQVPYAGSIIKANMDSDFAYCDNPVSEIQDMLDALPLHSLKRGK